jgi:hypothetical protein
MLRAAFTSLALLAVVNAQYCTVDANRADSVCCSNTETFAQNSYTLVRFITF